MYFRYLAVAAALAVLIMWLGPVFTKASKETVDKQSELYDSLDDDDTKPEE